MKKKTIPVPNLHQVRISERRLQVQTDCLPSGNKHTYCSQIFDSRLEHPFRNNIFL